MSPLAFALATVLTTATPALAGGPTTLGADTLASGAALALLVVVHLAIRQLGKK